MPVVPHTPPEPSRPTVLLVEAEPMLRLTTTKFLRRAGYEVMACPDGDSAAALLAAGGRGATLIVLCTRVLDAETAAVARRLHELSPRSQMLGIADAIDPNDPGQMPLPPGLRFLAPPFDMPDVLRAVRSHLSRVGGGIPWVEALEA